MTPARLPIGNYLSRRTLRGLAIRTCGSIQGSDKRIGKYVEKEKKEKWDAANHGQRHLLRLRLAEASP